MVMRLACWRNTQVFKHLVPDLPKSSVNQNKASMRQTCDPLADMIAGEQRRYPPEDALGIIRGPARVAATYVSIRSSVYSCL